ncbi:hypothetical protein BBF96_05980 [Anoxybacter fermentans]|uniref:ABC3 transporter permease protein domain-containing protein n=1 Tax=Anoxybacter fermentans TaxID=1323375 RepID=A0A3S9SXG2_9FIRM|nr:ABC transporter permease [Anoxybacter fermentans]AZR72981.1 hypothetical protein BBF96_05980 [Anoxybacter fermentans]
MSIKRIVIVGWRNVQKQFKYEPWYSIIIILGFAVALYSVITVIGMFEAERAEMRKNYFGNLLGRYVVEFLNNNGLPADLQGLTDQLKKWSNIEKIECFYEIPLDYGEIVGGLWMSPNVSEIYQVEKGRFFTFEEMNHKELVIVLSKRLLNQLPFLTEQIIGQQIQYYGTYGEIIGVIDNEKPVIYIPLKAFFEIIDLSQMLDNIQLNIWFKKGLKANQYKNLQETVAQYAGNSEFEIVSSYDKYKDSLMEMWLVGSFALLVVCGIFILATINMATISYFGIMRRRKEIGIRMAFGARKSDIIKLIIIENLFLVIGGFVLALFLYWVTFDLLNRYEFHITLSFVQILISFGIAFFGGILGGLKPAFYAVKMAPVEQIRNEEWL